MKKEELIGKEVKVEDSSNFHNIGITGKVIDETKNMLILKTKEGKKKLIKRQNTFAFRSKGEVFSINGKLLEKRPEERIK